VDSCALCVRSTSASACSGDDFEPTRLRMMRVCVSAPPLAGERAGVGINADIGGPKYVPSCVHTELLFSRVRDILPLRGIPLRPKLDKEASVYSLPNSRCSNYPWEGAMEIRVIDGNPVVTTTDVRNNLSTILSKVLKKYGSVIIEQKGVPVATIALIDKNNGTYKMERF